MARKKSIKSASPTIVRSLDLQSIEQRINNLSPSITRSYDIYSIEERLHNLEVNGGGGGSITTTLELDEPIESSTTSVTLEKGATYLFTTVYNGGNFTNATIMMGNTAAVYTKSGLGFACCLIKADSASVSYSLSGAVSDNVFIKLTASENVKDILSRSVWVSGTSLTASVGDVYVLISEDDETVTGADVIGSYTLETSTNVPAYIKIVKASATTITYNSKTFHSNRLVGGDLFSYGN